MSIDPVSLYCDIEHPNPDTSEEDATGMDNRNIERIRICFRHVALRERELCARVVDDEEIGHKAEAEDILLDNEKDHKHRVKDALNRAGDAASIAHMIRHRTELRDFYGDTDHAIRARSSQEG